jgi:uncharacterized protein
MRFAVTMAVVALCAYLGYCAALFFMQTRIIFPGRRTDAAQITALRNYYKELSDFEVKTPDAVLKGYVLSRPESGNARALLYFGGNAEEAGGIFLWAPQALPDWTIVSVNYRGYGENDGEPSMEALLRDAPEVYDALKAKLGPGARIAVMGRSIGTAPALRVAAVRDPAGLILVTPFDNLATVAADHYPFAPVSLLMRHTYDALPDAARVTAPTLILVAAADSLTRPDRAEALAEAWKGPKEYRVLPGGHNSVSDGELYWEVIKDFLGRVHSGRP